MARGGEQAVPGGRPGALLRLLLAKPDRPVPHDDLAAALWPTTDPELARRRLYVVASRLRKQLPAGVDVVATDAGYRIDAPPEAIDVVAFERLSRRAWAGDVDAARTALALWHDRPWDDFPDDVRLTRQRQRLATIRSRLQAVLDGDAATGTTSALQRPTGWAPTPLDHEVDRTDLLARVPTIGSTRLLEVTAPGGFGKTTLLAQWARRGLGQVAWLDLTPAHDSPAALYEALWTALAAGVGVTPPEPRTGDGRQPNPADLVNCLLASTDPVGIVLDGLHHVTSASVHDTLAQLLLLLPPNVTVATASRRKLPFSAGRLAVDDAWQRLDADDLAFTVEEVRDVLGHVAPPQSGGNGSRASAIHAATEGWPAAVVARATPPASAPSDASVHPDTDALLDDVLAGLQARMVRFLADTAHLDHLEPDLCDAVTRTGDSQQILRSLARDHQLVVSDRAGRRHRRIIAEGFRREDRRRPTVRSPGHAPAARWHHDQGRAVEALDHAAAAGDTALVGATLEPAVREALQEGDADALARWAATIPLDTIDAGHASGLPLVATAFLPAHRRGHWDVRCWDHASIPVDVLHAVDLARAGRCRKALLASSQAREQLSTTTTGIADTIDVLLEVSDAHARLLLGEDGPSGTLLRRAEGTRWPWLVLWAYGQRSLLACVSGDHGRAGALLDRAWRRAGTVHQSWQGAATATVTEVLVDLQRPAEHASPPDIVTRLQAALATDLNGTDRAHPPGPIAVVAQYALHLAHRRAGDPAAAEAALAAAEHAHHDLRHLPFLAAARTRILDAAVDLGESGVSRLSPREREVLHHLDSDLTLARIADRLYLSIHTVKSHTRSIYRKLGVHGRAEAVSRHLYGAST